jgi:hypothetical protein
MPLERFDRILGFVIVGILFGCGGNSGKSWRGKGLSLDPG